MKCCPPPPPSLRPLGPIVPPIFFIAQLPACLHRCRSRFHSGNVITKSEQRLFFTPVSRLCSPRTRRSARGATSRLPLPKDNDLRAQEAIRLVLCKALGTGSGTGTERVMRATWKDVALVAVSVKLFLHRRGSLPRAVPHCLLGRPWTDRQSRCRFHRQPLTSPQSRHCCRRRFQRP